MVHWHAVADNRTFKINMLLYASLVGTALANARGFQISWVSIHRAHGDKRMWHLSTLVHNALATVCCTMRLLVSEKIQARRFQRFGLCSARTTRTTPGPSKQLSLALQEVGKEQLDIFRHTWTRAVKDDLHPSMEFGLHSVQTVWRRGITETAGRKLLSSKAPEGSKPQIKMSMVCH